MKQIEVGSKVRFTGKFLRHTGQVVGGEGQKVFTVIGIDGSFIVVNELVGISCFSAAELEADPSLKWRRINADNVQVVK